MSQLPFNFGRLYTLDEEYAASLRAVSDVVASVSPLVAAGASGVDSSDLIKMLTPGSARHFRLRTAMAIGAIPSVAQEQRAAILAPINRAMGFGPPVPLRPLTGDEKFTKLADRLHAMGMSGVIDEALR